MKDIFIRRARLPSIIMGTLLFFVCPFFLWKGSVLAKSPCSECHSEQVEALMKGPHRGVVAEGASFCEACHGDAARHLESNEAQDIRGGEALSKTPLDARDKMCLKCHASDFQHEELSPHSGKVSCWDCHRDAALHFEVETPRTKTAKNHTTWRLCTGCHKTVSAQFRLQYRHPVEEGMMDCTDCHDIHGKGGGEDAMRAACIKCHPEQRGPYLFEHPPAAKGCTTCHRPHGSWNRTLLASNGNGMCLTCHLQSNFPGVGRIPHNFKLNAGARCWDCHSQVHGSNTTPDFNPRGRR